ncbi:MAG: hypothetical protein AB8G99_11500 [Planctomycetaceae bacterium]
MSKRPALLIGLLALSTVAVRLIFPPAPEFEHAKLPLFTYGDANEPVTFSGTPLSFPGTLLVASNTPPSVSTQLLSERSVSQAQTFDSTVALNPQDSPFLDVERYTLDETLVNSMKAANNFWWLRTRCGPDGPAWTGAFKNLRGLEIFDVPSQELTDMPVLAELQWLQLGVRRSGDQVASELPSIPKLEVLIFSGTYVPVDRQLPVDGQCPNLRVLSMKSAAITDSGVAKLVEACPKLEYVNLSRARKLTSDSINSLVKLKSLKYIHIGNTGIDNAKLKARMPKCRVAVGS